MLNAADIIHTKSKQRRTFLKVPQYHCMHDRVICINLPNEHSVECPNVLCTNPL